MRWLWGELGRRPGCGAPLCGLVGRVGAASYVSVRGAEDSRVGFDDAAAADQERTGKRCKELW